MGWATVQFYPTAESSPYEAFDLEAKMTWGQLQVLAKLLNPSQPIAQQPRGRSPIPTPIKTNASLDRMQSVTSLDIFRVSSVLFSLLG
jgi:transcription-repair coupling factor (superfamily II helicase)